MSHTQDTVMITPIFLENLRREISLTKNKRIYKFWTQYVLKVTTDTHRSQGTPQSRCQEYPKKHIGDFQNKMPTLSYVWFVLSLF